MSSGPRSRPRSWPSRRLCPTTASAAPRARARPAARRDRGQPRIFSDRRGAMEDPGRRGCPSDPQRHRPQRRCASGESHLPPRSEGKAKGVGRTPDSQRTAAMKIRSRLSETARPPAHAAGRLHRNIHCVLTLDCRHVGLGNCDLGAARLRVRSSPTRYNGRRLLTCAGGLPRSSRHRRGGPGHRVMQPSEPPPEQAGSSSASATPTGVARVAAARPFAGRAGEVAAG